MCSFVSCVGVYPDKDHPIVRWREEQLEEAVLTDLRSLRIEDEKDRQWFREKLVASIGDEAFLREERLKALRRRLADLEAQQKRLLDAYLAGAVDKNTFTAKTTQFKDEIAKTEGDLQTSKAGPVTGFEHVVEVFDLAQVAAERWEVSDKVGRREILDTILLKRSLSATSLETTKKKPFDVFAKGPILNKSRTSHPDFERVPLGFLAWFLDPSLQRNVIEELMADWVAGTLDDGPFEAHA